MQKIKRAIIMAAGKGERLAPATNNRPKPLVKVNGVRMIDTIVQALLKNSIQEIYVVVGYKKEVFIELLEDYPFIELIENPYYDTTNNISSIFVAREKLENSIIIEGDQIVSNPDMILQTVDSSGYSCHKINSPTQEWAVYVDEEGQIIDVNKNGSDNADYELHGVSYWTQEDGRKLGKLLDIEFSKKNNRQIYWDEVALLYHRDEFLLKVKEMQEEDILEIDCFDELVKIDPSYRC